MDEPGAGHRLDDGADGLTMNLVDSPREGPQRVDVRWNDELVQMFSLLGEQADVDFLSTEIESSVQHVERVLLGARFSVNTASVSPKGTLLHGSPKQ